MDELLNSGLGAEPSDLTLHSKASRTVWLLKPLPRNQVNPAHTYEPVRVGPPPALTSSCLDQISAHFDQYDIQTLVGVPVPHVRRIMDKVRADRHYAVHDEEEGHMIRRPDEATIWAYSAFADPEGTSRSITLGLDPYTILETLVPDRNLEIPDHPLIYLPKLYAAIQPQSPFHLLTTIKFDGMTKVLNDQTIMSLRYASHLTTLWTTGCSDLTDTGIRLLASALRLPGPDAGDEVKGLGMWRLRAWYLRGCKQIGDRSMRSLARWPGLLLLDVRDTSCTSAARTIFNTACEELFACRLAHFQPVNTGLQSLFHPTTPPATIMSSLAQTLLVVPGSPPESYLSLNIVPSYVALPDECLPVNAQRRRHNARNVDPSFRSGGLGHIYGQGIVNITDEVQSKRRDVYVALKMQAIEDGLMKDDWKEQKKKRKEEDKEEKKLEKALGNPNSRASRQKRKVLKGYRDELAKGKAGKENKGNNAPEMKGVPGQSMLMGEGADLVHESDRCLMLVRVAQEGWEEMEWSIPASNAVAGAGPAPTAISSSQRTARRNDLVGDLLSSLGPSSQAAQSPISASQAPPLPISSQSSPFAPLRKSTNPFKSGSSTGRFGTATAPVATLAASNSSSTDPFGGSFGDSSAKKRRFEGNAEGEQKRRGMKMFSGARLS